VPKNFHQIPPHQRADLPGIAYILAFLIGVLLFLFFGEKYFHARPDPFWIALLMGLSVSATVFWVWSATHKEDDNND